MDEESEQSIMAELVRAGSPMRHIRRPAARISGMSWLSLGLALLSFLGLQCWLCLGQAPPRPPS